MQLTLPCPASYSVLVKTIFLFFALLAAAGAEPLNQAEKIAIASGRSATIRSFGESSRITINNSGWVYVYRGTHMAAYGLSVPGGYRIYEGNGKTYTITLDP